MADIDGTDDDDILFSGVDADSIHGLAGDDALFGFDGDDELFGGEGDDLLLGGLGSDTIGGAAGENVLTGGLGNDVFVITSLLEVDRVTDFDTDPVDGQDAIDVSAGGFGSFADLLAAGMTITQIGADTLIGFGAGGPEVTLFDIAAASIDATDFIV